MEPKRLESPLDPETAARDTQVEALLVDGLDHYFARRYDEAIHLWTRVLFLDRSHARARAYIERARSALAERQRRAEELLEIGHRLIDQGNPDAARDVLAEAVVTTGEDERASALRLRLERVERAQGAAVTPGHVRSASLPAALPGWTWHRHRHAAVTTGLVGGVVLLATSLFAVPAVRSLMGLPSSRGDLTVASGLASMPALSSAEVALVRARTLYSRGRLAEALRALDRVGPESPSRAVADAMRIEIQRLLLASGRESPRPPAGRGPDTR